MQIYDFRNVTVLSFLTSPLSHGSSKLNSSMAVTVSGDDGNEHESAFQTSGGNLLTSWSVSSSPILREHSSVQH